MTIGAKIREARLKAGLTQKGLAKKLNVTYQQVQKWETGERNPKIKSLRKIADALGVDWVELVE